MRVSGWWALTAVLLMTGCDSFSVIDQFSSAVAGPGPTAGSNPTPAPTPGPGGLVLGVQTPTLQQNGTTLLVPRGGTPPYSYSALADSLSYTGTLGSVDAGIPQYTAGTSIGTMKIRVIDNLGNHYDATVTVLPPPPSNFAVTFTTSPKRGNLTWTSPNLTYVSGYQLWYRTNSGAGYTLLASPAKSATSYTHNGAGTNYSYKLNTVMGAYQSPSVEAP